MALPTQGTVLYAIDPADDSVITVGCITSLNGIDTTNEQIETTCLSDQARTYLAGLSTPGTASFDINFDTSDASHMRMRELKVAGTTLQWAVGISDDTAPPTVTGSGASAAWSLPSTRSWIDFEGFMTNWPFDFSQNSVVQSSVGIQISGEPDVTAAT